VSAVRVAQQHLGDAPVPAGEGMLHGASAGRLEAVRITGPDQRLDLGVRTAGALDDEQVGPARGMLQPARVSAGLELHLIAERLPERHGLAPVTGLDNEPFNSGCPHAFSLAPRGPQMLPQRRSGDRRQ